MYGLIAVGIGLLFLVVLLTTIVYNGTRGFTQTFVTVDVYLDPAKLDKTGNRDLADIKKVSTFGYAPLIDQGLFDKVQADGIETSLAKPKDMRKILSAAAPAIVRDYVIANPDQIGETVEFRLLAASRVDGYLKGRVSRTSITRDKNIDAAHLDLTDKLVADGVVHKRFNLDFILGADASESRAEQAGLGVSILGSLFMMLVVLVLVAADRGRCLRSIWRNSRPRTAGPT